MKVILLSSVESVGLPGDVASVKNGYYRNFLGPRGMAVVATPSNLKTWESRRASMRAEAEAQVKDAESVGERLKEIVINFSKRAAANDRLYGSVTGGDIAEQLALEGYEVEKRNIVLPGPIKSIGEFRAVVKIHSHVHIPVKIVVVKEITEEEARAAEEEAALMDLGHSETYEGEEGEGGAEGEESAEPEGEQTANGAEASEPTPEETSSEAVDTSSEAETAPQE